MKMNLNSRRIDFERNIERRRLSRPSCVATTAARRSTGGAR